MLKNWGTPNAKQEKFLLSGKKYTAYGGARGGGKSWAVRVKAALLCLGFPGIKVLLLRRTYRELEGNHIRELSAMLAGIASYNDQKKVFSFPGGSLLLLSYCASDADLSQYQGQEYDCVFIDEATQFTEEQFRILGACLRGVNDFPKRMYLTCNPGGIGHEWVRRLFVERRYKDFENADDYLFIPATVADNASIGADYVNFLKSLPSGTRDAWLHGRWDLFDGRYFSEFDEKLHVMKPFEIPECWPRYFAMDYGLDMLAGYWIAVDFDGRAYVYREIYESGLIISEAAKRVKFLSREPVFLFIAPPDLWNRRQDTGRSAAEIFSEHGINLYKADNSRVQGWYELREWLKPAGGGPDAVPSLRVFECCRNLIRTLPALQYSGKNPNDCDDMPHEITHAPDALRYFVSARPAPRERAEERPDGYPGYREQIDAFLGYGR